MITSTRRGRPRSRPIGGAISRWLLGYIERENLTISGAALKIGVGQSTLSDWLRGAKNPGSDAVTAMIGLGMPVETYLEHVAIEAEKKLTARR